MPPRNPVLVAVATAALILISATGCDVVTAGDPGAPGGSGSNSSSGTDSGSGSAADSSAALGTLEVVAKTGSMAGYSREKFPHWRDAGDNCDVRDTVLKRDGENVKFSGCNVVAGSWNSLYDGVVVDSPTKVDIDHMVPLAAAWRSGAAKWTTEQRGDFANDLDRPQLVAVSATSNRSKGDQDPSTWKPPARDSWCSYAQDWIEVKTFWKLNVTQKEKDALTDMLGTC